MIMGLLVSWHASFDGTGVEAGLGMKLTDLIIKKSTTKLLSCVIKGSYYIEAAVSVKVPKNSEIQKKIAREIR